MSSSVEIPSMSDDIAISVQGVNKAYRIWNSPASRLFAPTLKAVGDLLPNDSTLAAKLNEKAAGYYRDYWALKDISFEVKKGECLGIIGRNGSGKSTLLQIIAGTLQPTSGFIKVAGRVAALLELGSGFNPEFTGRENVYLNGAVLGLSRNVIDAKFKEIADFADIGDFIEQPVKTYSSGMLMRLAFAVQTAVQPNILIVDEALTVGDAPFQAKCFKRMRDLASSNVSILIVSHDIATVRALSQRALCLSEGSMYTIGQAKSTCDAYQILCMSEQGILPAVKPADASVPYVSRASSRIEFDKIANQQRAGSGNLKLLDCYLVNSSGERISCIEFNEKVQVCWLIESRTQIHCPISIAITIKTIKGVEVLSSTDKEFNESVNLSQGQQAAAILSINLPLKAGKYYITTSIFKFPAGNQYINGTINFDESELLDLVEYSCYFEVDWCRRWAHYGPVQLDGKLDFIALEKAT
jgi:lipopolysaccharide transport system ATP-binding protein